MSDALFSFLQSKATVKTEYNKVQSGQVIAEQGHREDTKSHTSSSVSAAGGKHQKNRKPKHKRLMPLALGSLDGKL